MPCITTQLLSSWQVIVKFQARVELLGQAWNSFLKDNFLQSCLLLHVYCQFLSLSLVFKSIIAIVHVLLLGTQGKVFCPIRAAKCPTLIFSAVLLSFSYKIVKGLLEAICFLIPDFSCHQWNILKFIFYEYTVIRNYHRK